MAVKYPIPAIAVAVLVLVVWYFGMATFTISPPPPIASVTIGTTTVQVEVADTDAARTQGLSGRSSLAEGRGMLFVFDTPGTYGFWMKDMNFPLDIIFANASGTIVTIYPNLSPDSYNKTPPDIFYPTSPAKYVLEVPAGFAAAHGVGVGQQIVLQ